jgi:hypothetical protein
MFLIGSDSIQVVQQIIIDIGQPLALTATQAVDELVAHNRIEPSPQIGTQRVMIRFIESAQDSILNKILTRRAIPRQHHGEGTHCREGFNQLVMESGSSHAIFLSVDPAMAVK